MGNINRIKAHTPISIYPKGGVFKLRRDRLCCKDIKITIEIVVNGRLVFHPDSHQDKFCGKSPAVRVGAKRYASA